MHCPRIYVDTSVIGGCCDAEFMPESRALIDMVQRGNAVLLVSEVLMNELERGAPPDVRKILTKLPEQSLVPVEVNDEVRALWQRYLDAHIVGKSAEIDALHVAIASVWRADVIASWNFRHIVHLDKIRQYNAVNLMQGYPPIEIRSPKELAPYEDSEDQEDV